MSYVLPATYDLPFASGSDTSEAAARRAAKFVGKQGAAVLAWIASCPHGSTQPEAAAALGIGRPSACARFHALEQRGEIVKTDERRSGCVVYRAR
jgi:hypothetical protein